MYEPDYRLRPTGNHQAHYLLICVCPCDKHEPLPSFPQVLVLLGGAGHGGDVNSRKLAQGCNCLPLPELQAEEQD